MRAGSLRATQLWARIFAGWVLIVTGGLFALLWLSELVPATLSGQAASSLEIAGLTMNPIHVIDVSVVLPGRIIIGVLALRGNKKGLFLTLPALVFSIADGIGLHRRDGADRRERGHERLGSDGDGRRCCRRQPRLPAPDYWTSSTDRNTSIGWEPTRAGLTSTSFPERRKISAIRSATCAVDPFLLG